MRVVPPVSAANEPVNVGPEAFFTFMIVGFWSEKYAVLLHGLEGWQLWQIHLVGEPAQDPTPLHHARLSPGPSPSPTCPLAALLGELQR